MIQNEIMDTNLIKEVLVDLCIGAGLAGSCELP